MIPFQTMSITDFVNTTFPCDCGKEHRMDMDRIMVSEGAIQDIPDLMAQYGYVKAYLIADENTWRAAVPASGLFSTGRALCPMNRLWEAF